MIKIIETEDKIKVYNNDALLKEFDALRFKVSSNSDGFICIYEKKSHERVFLAGREHSYYLCMRKVTQ